MSNMLNYSTLLEVPTPAEVLNVCMWKDTLIAALYNRTILLFDLKTRSHSTLNQGTFISCMVLFNDYLVLGDERGDITIWDLNQQQKLKTLKAHGQMIKSLYVSDNLMISTAGKEDVKIWDLPSLDMRKQITTHFFNNAEKLMIWKDEIISIGCNHLLYIDLKTEEMRKIMEFYIYNGKKEPQIRNFDYRCHYLYDDRLYIGVVGGNVFVVNLNTKTVEKEYISYGTGMKSLIILKDKLICAGENKTIKIINKTTGEKERTIKGHTEMITALANWEDNLISAGFDKTIRIWKINW